MLVKVAPSCSVQRTAVLTQLTSLFQSTIFYSVDTSQLPISGKSKLAAPHQPIKIVEHDIINFSLQKQNLLEEAKLLLLVLNKEELVENSEGAGSLKVVMTQGVNLCGRGKHKRLGIKKKTDF